MRLARHNFYGLNFSKWLYIKQIYKKFKEMLKKSIKKQDLCLRLQFLFLLYKVQKFVYTNNIDFGEIDRPQNIKMMVIADDKISSPHYCGINIFVIIRIFIN